MGLPARDRRSAFRVHSLALAALLGCSRSELLLFEGDSLVAPDASANNPPDASQPSLPDASTKDAAEVPDTSAPDAVAFVKCPPFPPLPPPPSPPPLGQACRLSLGTADTTPVLAAIIGQDLLGLTPQGTFTPLFHFSADASSPSTYNLQVTSRGDFVGAMVAATSPVAPDNNILDVEFVVVRLDGTVVVHHRESFNVTNNGGGFGMTGNAAGTFAFSAAMGDGPEVDQTWLTVADGTILGPMTGAIVGSVIGAQSSRLVEPDEKGHVFGWATSTAVWMDFCANTQTPSTLLSEGIGAGAWGDKLFGITNSGVLATETADGETLLPHPALNANAGDFWDFVPPGVAMIALPSDVMPFGPNGTLDVVNAATLLDHQVSLAYPAGVTVVPPDAWLSQLGDSNDPAGFGLDSAGHITMFLTDGSGNALFETTETGADWTPVGQAVPWDAMDSNNPQFIEAAGTYVLQGTGNGATLELVRPAAGIATTIAGPPVRIARDGGCVAVLASANELDLIDATTGATTKVALPSPANTQVWASSWIPGDDAVINLP